MTTRKNKDQDILTSKQLKTVLSWSGNLTAAARAAGYSDPKSATNKLRNDPEVINKIRMKQDAMIKESGKRLGQQIDFSRSDVINRLWQLAQISPEETSKSIGGQIKAAEALAQIFDIKIVRTPDLDRELKARTEEEVDFFVTNGYYPEEAGKANEQI